MHRRMDSDTDLWLRRPLAADLLEYAAADVAGLLPLAERLEAELLVRPFIPACLRWLAPAGFKQSPSCNANNFQNSMEALTFLNE